MLGHHQDTFRRDLLLEVVIKTQGVLEIQIALFHVGAWKRCSLRSATKTLNRPEPFAEVHVGSKWVFETCVIQNSSALRITCIGKSGHWVNASNIERNASNIERMACELPACQSEPEIIVQTPSNMAPSFIPIDGVQMLPWIFARGPSSTRSWATISPFTVPLMTATATSTLASIL